MSIKKVNVLLRHYMLTMILIEFKAQTLLNFEYHGFVLKPPIETVFFPKSLSPVGEAIVTYPPYTTNPKKGDMHGKASP